MKKLFISILFLMVCCLNVKADDACNTYYKVNINIAGNGVLNIKDSDKSFTKDAVVNVKCDDDFVFEATADDGFTVKGVYSDGNFISPSGKSYSIVGISSNINLKVIFTKEEDNSENEMFYSSNEDNISLYIDDVKENLDSNQTLKFNLKEVTVTFDNDFIKNSNESITLVANEIYKNDLNIKEQKAVKDALYYAINLYNGEELVTDLKGTATISIPYSKMGKVFVYRVEKNGKITLIDSEYKEGRVTFKVSELGKFALSKEELSELNYIKTIINLNNNQKIAIVSLGFVLALLIVFIKIRKRK